MRRPIGILTAITLATVGVLTTTAGPAAASPAAPDCSSGGSRFVCVAQPGSAPIVWTVTVRSSTSTSIYHVSTASNVLRASCIPATTLTVVYTSAAGQTSAPATFTCLSGPPV